MQGDDIEFAGTAIGGEVFERRFVEMDIACACCFRQGARAGDMSGVEIDRGIVEMRIGGGDEICRKALSTAKLKNTQRLGRKTRRDNAFRQGREGQILRGEMVIAVGIVHLGEVARVPMGHFKDNPKLDMCGAGNEPWFPFGFFKLLINSCGSSWWQAGGSHSKPSFNLRVRPRSKPLRKAPLESIGGRA